MGGLDQFEVQYNDPGDQLREVIRMWLITSENPTWEAMAQALSSWLARKLQ